jgi:hypothetical protein
VIWAMPISEHPAPMRTNSPFETTEIKPRLKLGVIVTAVSGTKPQSHFIGHAAAGIQISHPGAAAIVANFVGLLTCFEISIKTGAPFEVVNKIYDELVAANLIDQVCKPIVLADRFRSEKTNRKTFSQDQSKDVAYQQLQELIAPELGQITWQSGIIDAGVTTLSDRQKVAIDICGDDRLAISLLTVLLASGVSQTSLALSNVPRDITASDLGTGVFAISDLGTNLVNRISEITRDFALFPISKSATTTNYLTVIFGAPDPAKINTLLSANLPHLFIGALDATTLRVGPLVIPGKSPCSRCIELDQLEQSPLLNQINQARLFASVQQLNIAATAQFAGLIAQCILNYLDTGVSELIGTQILLDTANPCNPQHIAYAINPACGCAW